MNFALIAILAGLATGADKPRVQGPQNWPACNHLDDVVYKATSNSCSIYAQNRINCLERFKDVFEEVPFAYYFAQAQEACKDEMAKERPKSLLKQFKKDLKREKKKCKRADLNKEDQYACEQRPKDIKMLEEIISNNRKK